jgi:uncharacterized repeat protein (TIGR03803 family)
MRRFTFGLLAALLALVVYCPSRSLAQTYTYSVLLNFPSSGGPYGASSPLTIDSKGNLYGSSGPGYLSPGSSGYGDVFEVSPAGMLTVLYNFGADGYDAAYPVGSLARNKSTGNLYGVTLSNTDGNCFDGDLDCGSVFEITPAGVETLLYSLPQQCGDPGPYFVGYPVLNSAGDLYGSYYCPVSNDAEDELVFEITPKDKVSDVYVKKVIFGKTPSYEAVESTWIINKSGDLYGYGYDYSTELYSIVELTPKGKLTIDYTFTSGVSPLGKLAQSASGDFFGATMGFDPSTGSYTGNGTVFEFTSKKVYSTLYSFCSQTDCADGSFPAGFLTSDSSGNLYGLAFDGGSNDDGVVFKITPSGQETVIYNFVEPNAGNGNISEPEPNTYYVSYGLVMDSSGNLYGVDNSSSNVGCIGGNGTGCIYKLTKN